MNRLEQANHILYDLGLLNELNKYGTAHIIGSYKMNLMAWNDLDIDVEIDSMSLEKLHQLKNYILDHFNPTWHEAKEEINEQGNKVWFQGFEFYLNNELWNVDIWFLDKDTIEKAEKYCDDISEKVKDDEHLKTAIIAIKQELIKRNLYSFDQYTSMDVYDAIINKRINNINDFLKVIEIGEQNMYNSEFCEVSYNSEYNVVFIKWKKFCKIDEYRKPLLYALEIIKEYNCDYVADTRNGFEDDPEDTVWVKDYFIPKVVEYGCKTIYFIIDKDNSLADELKGQEEDSKDKITFKYIYDLTDIKEL